MSNYNTITSDHSRSRVVYSAITLDISGTVTDYDVKENTTLFDKINYGREIVIRNTEEVSVRFNSTENDLIDLLPNEGINMVGMPVSNIYLTSTGGTTKVRIIMVGWN